MILDHKNQLEIKTPEGVIFNLALAGPVSRCLALLIDLLTIALIYSLFNYGIKMVAAVNMDWGMGLQALIGFLVMFVYYIGSEWFWRGKTLGKHLLRLRVMDVMGLKLKFSQVVIRNLSRVLDMIPLLYFVGGVTSLINRKNQRLGDIAAATVVMRNPKIREPDLDQILARKYNSFRSYPHLVGRLRQRISPMEASLALQALLRRDYLKDEARVHVFAALAHFFKEKLAFPEEATEGLSDEQYVRNTVDVLFRTEGSAAIKKQTRNLDEETAAASQLNEGLPTHVVDSQMDTRETDEGLTGPPLGRRANK